MEYKCYYVGTWMLFFFIRCSVLRGKKETKTINKLRIRIHKIRATEKKAWKIHHVPREREWTSIWWVASTSQENESNVIQSDSVPGSAIQPEQATTENLGHSLSGKCEFLQHINIKYNKWLWTSLIEFGLGSNRRWPESHTKTSLATNSLDIHT